MRAAAVQFFATPFNLDRNLETAVRLARLAAAQGAKLIALPGLFNTGYVYARRLAAAAEEADGPTLRWLAALSAELGAHLAGSLLLREEGKVFNVLALAKPDGQIHHYRARRAFLWERGIFKTGHAPLVVETEIGRIGLMAGWDMAERKIWEAYRGRVDVLLVASAAPRLHRGVLNFPQGRKVYTAQLLPAFLREREAIDAWFEAGAASGAARCGVPVVQAAMAGRFVTELPWPRLSFWMMALRRPRYWAWAGQAHLATLRATFYAGSAIYSAEGEALAKAEADEEVIVAEVRRVAGPTMTARARAEPLITPNVPLQLHLLDSVLGLLSKRIA